MNPEKLATQILVEFQADEEAEAIEGLAWTEGCDLIRHLIRTMADNYRYDPEVLALMIVRQQHVT